MLAAAGRVRDSATAKTITHEYDLPVLAERIRSLSRWRSAAGSAPACTASPGRRHAGRARRRRRP